MRYRSREEAQEYRGIRAVERRYRSTQEVQEDIVYT